MRKELFDYVTNTGYIYPGIPMKMQNIVWTNTNSPGKVQQNFDDIKDIKDGKGSINYYNAEFYVSVLN